MGQDVASLHPMLGDGEGGRGAPSFTQRVSVAGLLFSHRRDIRLRLHIPLSFDLPPKPSLASYRLCSVRPAMLTCRNLHIEVYGPESLDLPLQPLEAFCNFHSLFRTPTHDYRPPAPCTRK
eukprot:scaffold5420_cov27-Tisochrysis_lutea.AAC.4